MWPSPPILRFALSGPLILSTLLTAGCAHPTTPSFTATVSGAAGTCVVQVGGRDVTSDQLLAIAREEVTKNKRAQLLGTSDVPYRCIGQAIYMLQVAGFAAVDFRTEPLSTAP